MKNLVIKRAKYGKKDVPVEKRDYQIAFIPGAPYGTIKETIEFVNEQNLPYDRLEIHDMVSHPGKVMFVDFDRKGNYTYEEVE